jgi:hypothetical protein
MAGMGVILSFLIVLLTIPVSVTQAASFTCTGGIISAGDSRTDLIMKCGEPDRKDSHNEEIVERTDREITRKIYITVEEWTYDLGPRQFMRIVTIKNGTISDIRTGGYGHPKQNEAEQRECGGRVISVGDVKSEVLAKCGEPAVKDSRQEELREKSGEDREHRVFVTIEEWTYDFGPNRFMRIITFRNGTVSDIRTGGYGYQRDSQ